MPDLRASPLAFILAAATLLLPSTASGDPATAEALFREGRRLLDEGKTDAACAKLAESQTQDPSSGTLLNLGLCHETQGKLATAWSDYVSAARLAREQGRPDRTAVADRKAADLEPRLPYLTVTAAAPTVGLEIVRNDDRLGPGVLGTPVPLDPGSYVITASAPGHRSWKAAIDIAEHESRTVQVPPLEPEAATPAEPPPPPPPMVAMAPALPPPTPVPPSPSGSRTTGWIVGGAGVAALAVGTGFGIASLVSYNDAGRLCPSHAGCSDAAMSARAGADTKAWVANIALGVGVVGVAIGGYILLSGTGRPAEPATRLAIRGAPDAPGMRVSLERTF